MPGEDGVRLDHTGDFFQDLLPKLFANLRECFALCIGQSHAALDLATQETILCHQVFNAEQEFLVYGACDVHEELLPIHMRSSPSDSSAYTDGEYARLRDERQEQGWTMIGRNH